MWPILETITLLTERIREDTRYLAGALHWRTGKLLTTRGDKKDGALFVAHLHDLRRHLRCYRVIHVICDNAKFHKGRAVQRFLAAHPGRVVLHYLPRYAPELNADCPSAWMPIPARSPAMSSATWTPDGVSATAMTVLNPSG